MFHNFHYGFQKHTRLGNHAARCLGAGLRHLQVLHCYTTASHAERVMMLLLMQNGILGVAQNGKSVQHGWHRMT
jgi:hypothetical protein